MANINYRHPGEDAARPGKENAPVYETEATSATAPLDSTPDAPRETTRPLFHALTWRTPEVQDGDQAQQTPDPVVGWHALAAPAKAKLPRGKAKRNARREAVASKRHQAGGATLDAMCLAAGVFWLASVCAWLLVEVLP